VRASRLPDTNDALVLRTDFSDEAAWAETWKAIDSPASGFKAYVDFVSDRDFENATVEELVAANDPGNYRTYVFVVDGVTLTHPERPVLVIDLFEDIGRTFRVIPSEMWSVENNLSIANMDFAEFAEAADADGIFRGYPGAP
jgi:hypothetical protein